MILAVMTWFHHLLRRCVSGALLPARVRAFNGSMKTLGKQKRDIILETFVHGPVFHRSSKAPSLHVLGYFLTRGSSKYGKYCVPDLLHLKDDPEPGE